MDYQPATLPTGLSCSPSPLGLAAPMIIPTVQTATEELLFQICERPADASYSTNSDGTTVSFDTELVRIYATVANDGRQEASPCYAAFKQILNECVSQQGVWGGVINDPDSGVVYTIEEAKGADMIVKELEYLQDHDAGPTATVIASAVPSGVVASGFPEQSGVVSGIELYPPIMPTDSFEAIPPAMMPTNSYQAIPPAYTYVVPSGYPQASGYPEASGYPQASGVEASGYVSGWPWAPAATPVVPADTMPGAKEYPTFDKRGEGAYVEEKRPRVRWIAA